MPRGKAQQKTRRPTFEDLSIIQRRIFNLLPEDAQEDYLGTLPDIRLSDRATSQKTDAIKARLNQIGLVIDTLQEQERHLKSLIGSLQSGLDPRNIDLKKELGPPTIDGAVLRYTRGSGKGKQTAEEEGNEDTGTLFGEEMTSEPNSEDAQDEEFRDGQLIETIHEEVNGKPDLTVEPFTEDQITEYHNHEPSESKRRGRPRKAA